MFKVFGENSEIEMEEFKISQSSYLTHVRKMMADMLASADTADVTLVADDKTQITAHRAVLAACSPVLRSWTSDSPHPRPLLYLRGIQAQEVTSLLQFMYLGETRVTVDRVAVFLEVARDLEVRGIVHAAEDEQLKIETAHNVETVHDEREYIRVLSEKFHKTPKTTELMETIEDEGDYIKALSEKFDCHFESTVHYSVSHPMIVEMEAAEQTEDGEDDKDEDKIKKDNLKHQKLSAHEDEEFLPCNSNIMSMNTKNRL